MRILRGIQPGNPCVLALGTFDGIHRGHSVLLEKTLREAAERHTEATVCTFDRIPAAVLHPERRTGMLMTAEERLRELERRGFDSVCLIPFNAETMSITAEEFMTVLTENLHPVQMVVGFDYRFGRGGLGDPELLARFGEKAGFGVTVTDAVEEDGIKISSTRIRQELENGNIAKANALLGYEYSLEGNVVHGKGVGRTLGFPTANIEVPEEKQLPAFGVYACELTWNDLRRKAVVNIGLQPTLPSGKVTVEAFIPDGEYDLREKSVRLTLKTRIRGEKKFGSVDELKRQIAEDVKTAEKL